MAVAWQVSSRGTVFVVTMARSWRPAPRATSWMAEQRDTWWKALKP